MLSILPATVSSAVARWRIPDRSKPTRRAVPSKSTMSCSVGVNSIAIVLRQTKTSYAELLLGLGAQSEAAEALEILSAAGPIRNRVRGLRRMGQRRWDVLLDRGQVIQLPVERPVAALQRVIALHQARDVLKRDVKTVDVRDGRRPVLRLSSAAMEELHRLRAIADEEEDT